MEKKNVIDKLILGTSVGIILQWVALFFSYRKIPGEITDFSAPVATGGFPFIAFHYPVPPMGNDWPPIDAWPIFLLNLAVWITVGLFISVLIRKPIEIRMRSTLVLTALVLTLIGFGYLILQFD